MTDYHDEILPTNYDKHIISYLDPLQVSVYHYPSSSWIQEGGNKQICLRINWVVTESVHIHIETIHTSGSTHNALGKTFTFVVVQRSM